MNNEYYNLQYIKAIPIAGYLHACGIEPAKRYNGYTLYHAPYREDPNASLKVDFRQNLWHESRRKYHRPCDADARMQCLRGYGTSC